MSLFDSNCSQTDGTTKKIEYLIMLKLASKLHDSERNVTENLQKDWNEYAAAVKTYHQNYSTLCELVSQASDRDQIVKSSTFLEDIHSPSLGQVELEEKIEFLQRNSDFDKQRDFHCDTKDLPIATTVAMVTGWHRKNCVKGVSLNKVQNYVYRLKKSTGQIHKVFVQSNKRLKHSFKRLLKLGVKRIDHVFLKDVE